MSVYQTTFSDTKIETAVDREVVPLNELLARVRERMGARGSTGIRGIGRVFRQMDDDGNRKLNMREFSTALSDMGVQVNRAELKMLFKYFDKNKDGSVNFDEFLNGLRGKMNDFRQGLVIKAFNKLDRDRSGAVLMDEITSLYNASMHPKVQSGEATEEEIMQKFMNEWEGTQGNRDGKIETAEFIERFEGTSASIDRDDYFALMMKNAWGVEPDSPPF